MIDIFTPKFNKKAIKIIGCGLAGAEIALILANNGFDVHLFTNNANSSKQKFDYYSKYDVFMTENMKYELECLNSPLFSLAKRYDFENFGFQYDFEFMQIVKNKLSANNKIKIFEANIEKLSPTESTVIATGHKTDCGLLREIENFVGQNKICMFQPSDIIIDAGSVDLDKLRFVSEHECVVDIDEKEFEKIFQTLKEIKSQYQDDCQYGKLATIESFVERGVLGLKNAVFRPYISSNVKPFASLKMNFIKTQNALVLKNVYSAFDNEDQQTILNQFSMLKNCKVLEFGKVEKKTFLLAPVCLQENMQLKNCDNIFVCGGFCGTAGSFESLLMANFCAYSLMCYLNGKTSFEMLKKDTCISIILENLIKKSVVNFRLLYFKYDIIDSDDFNCENLKSTIEKQKLLSKNQIEKFKEKFYGKYF